MDDLDLESDDDKEYAVSTSAGPAAAEESAKHFSSASVAEMMEFGNTTAHATVSQSGQLPQDAAQKFDAVAASSSWQAAKAVCGDLTSIAPASGHDEDSDREHNIGRYQPPSRLCTVMCGMRLAVHFRRLSCRVIS